MCGSARGSRLTFGAGFRTSDPPTGGLRHVLHAFCVPGAWPTSPLARRLGLTTKLYTLNPKAMSVIELYGVLDPTTRDWTDGVLSNIFREVNKPTEKKERK